MENKYRSKEELYFSWWLDDLVEAGYVKGYEYEPESFELIKPVKYEWAEKMKTKVKRKRATLLQGLSYTPDFWIQWNVRDNIDKFLYINNIQSISSKGVNHLWSDRTRCDGVNPIPYFISVIDVKGSFDRNKSNSTFSIIQKVMYNKFHIYVNKVVPQKLFKATFTPRRYFETDKRTGMRNIGWEAKTLGEYLDELGRE